MPCRSSLPVGRIVLFAVLVPWSKGYAQTASDCPEGPVSQVRIENHSVFDPASIPQESRLAWAYRLANTVHMRTREEFIARELLFEEGGCPSSSDLEESARILRDYQFISRSEIFEVPLEDGSREIVVDTRDEWTTKPSLSLRLEDGVQFAGAAILEENLLGRGITAGAYRSDRDARRETGMRLEVPAVGGTRADAMIRGSRTRVGGEFRQEIVIPFLAEQPGMSFRQGLERNRDFFTYVLPEGVGGTHVVLPFVSERAELSAARRVGGPGRLFVVGGGLSYERIGLGAPEEAELVRSADFSNREPVPEVFSAPLTSQTLSRSALRLNGLAGFRMITYDTREGLDAVSGVQDLPIGHQALLIVGRSLGDAGPGELPDFLTQARYLFGHSGRRTVRQLHLRAEGRSEVRTPEAPGAFRDVLFEGHGITYFIPDSGPIQNVLLRGAVHAGWRTMAPFQLTLGGPDGVRGYGDADLPGGRRAVLSAEGRIRSPNPFSDLIDIGWTTFVDIGTIWGGDAPYGVDAGWRSSVGGGIRLGFPAGSSTVIRADIAFPVGPGAPSRSPVFRISAREWIGVLDPFQNLRMERSRRGGINGNYEGVARDRREWW